jgi:hypothetical protein
MNLSRLDDILWAASFMGHVALLGVLILRGLCSTGLSSCGFPNLSGVQFVPGVKVGRHERLGSDPIWESDLIGLRGNANCRPRSKAISTSTADRRRGL